MTCIRFSKGVYECRCMVNYKYVYIGFFKTEQDAKFAYNDFIIQNNLNRKLM
jgi:hypothetical protein